MEGSTLTEAQRALFDQLAAGKAPVAGVPRRSERGRFPLSFAQQRLWILEQTRPGTALFNSHLALRLHGPLDVPRLGRSLNAIVRRHDILRSSFRSIDGLLMQVVAPEMEIGLPLIDCAEGDVEACLREALAIPFDLARGPLIRARLVRTAPDDHHLIVVIHHGLFDGWSAEVLTEELARLYANAPVGELAIQYGDFSSWQRERLTDARIAPDVEYWHRHLDGASPVTTFPPDHLRRVLQSDDGAMYHTTIDGTTAARLRAFSAESGATLFMTLLAGFDALLSRYAGETNIVIGSPIAGRLVPESETLIGLFMNTLPIRVDLSGRPTFRQLVERVRRSAVAAYAHQELPFELLIEQLNPDRSTSHAPFCQVMFQLRSFPKSSQGMPGLEVERIRLDAGTAKNDLMLEVRDDGASLDCLFEYSTALYEQSTIERIGRHFGALLRAATTNPDIPVARLPILDDDERRTILVDWNRTASDYRAGETVGALFAEVAARQPDALAVVDGERRMSYGDLDRAAADLAEQIRNRGISPGSPIAIAMERSADAVIAALGVLQAGCCYVPLDPAWPEERTRVLIDRAGIGATLDASMNLRIVSSEAMEGTPRPVTPDDPIYIMYTSGSRGEPKGVAVPHRGVTRLVINTNYVCFTADDVVAMCSSFAFDGATFELWGALLHGAALVIVRREEVLDSHRLRELIELHRISIMFLTTSVFRQHAKVDRRMFRSLNTLVIGGEAVDAESVRPLLEHDGPANLINGYGPTEATTFAVTHWITPEDARRGVVPIGRPIANSTAYILDDEGEPQPIGVAGDLHLGGPGVAFGYIGRPDLTAERFIDSLFVPGERLYRTGDRARFRYDGVIEYLGRDDDQIKLRGFRIEPAEIEAALRHHPGVVHAAVVVRKVNDESRLIAYVTTRTASPAPDDIRRFVARLLPDFMVPSSFVILDTMPLNASGKIDRAALPAPIESSRSEQSQAPRDEVETMLAGLMKDNLGISSIGIDDDFFETGGSSLGAIMLIAAIEEKTSRWIPVEIFFRQPTIRGLAEALRDEAQSSSTVVTLRSAGARPPLFLIPGGDGLADKLLGYERLARELGDDRPIHGVCYRPDLHDRCATLQQLASSFRQQIEACWPDGPYLLAGHCVGGIMAYEVAQQLHARGRDVTAVALLETRRPVATKPSPAGGGSGARNRVVRIAARLAHHVERTSELSPASRIAYFVRRALRIGAWLPFLFGVRKPPDVNPFDESPYTRLVQDYRPRPFEGNIALIVSENATSPSEMLSWRELAPGLEVLRIPGDHMSILRKHAAAAAAAIREFVGRQDV